MRISDFVGLIANLPISCQAFTSRKSTWEKQFLDVEEKHHARIAFDSLFHDIEKVSLSRSDLKKYSKIRQNDQDLARFVVATIIWGCPGGMRGEHFKNIITNFNKILVNIPLAEAEDWHTHWEKIRGINGLGLSTYSKLLCFASVKIGGKAGFNALILDQRIIDVVGSGKFEELEPLKYSTNLAYYNAPNHYISYLECLNKLSEKFGVPAENIELFLFQYGQNLKTSDGLSDCTGTIK